jgi:hypothetical protein
MRTGSEELSGGELSFRVQRIRIDVRGSPLSVLDKYRESIDVTADYENREVKSKHTSKP